MSTDCDGGNVLLASTSACLFADLAANRFSEPALSAQIVFRFAAHRCVARETHAAARNDTRLVAGTDIFR